MTHIGIDIGGTRTRVAAVHPQSGEGPLDLVEFPTKERYREGIESICEVIRLRAWDATATGVSMTGRMSKDGRNVRVSLNLPDYEGAHLCEDLEHHLSLPTFAAHDATCGLVGELDRGGLADAVHGVYLTMSTGIGGAICIGNRTSRSIRSVEVGHQILDIQGKPCECGQRGCLEAYLGGKANHRALGRPLTEVKAAGFWTDYVERTAVGVANVVAITGIPQVCLGGAIALSIPNFIDDVQRLVDNIATYVTPQIIPASLGENAPIIGASCLPKVEYREILEH